MEKIMLVENDSFLLDRINEILVEEGYQVFPARQANLAYDLFVTVDPDLVKSDLMMPQNDGFELLRKIRSLSMGISVPFLFLTNKTERTELSQARELGVDDYLIKPFDADELLQTVRTRIDRRKVVSLFDTRKAHLQTITMLANVIEARDPYTAGHAVRVRNLALNLATELNWSREALGILELGAILHDVGKINIPVKILKKTGPLNEIEWDTMRRHPLAGAKILDGIDHLQPAIPYALSHHEWWNGSGYPNGLAGEDIPVEGRLLALADAYDAMTTNRPYHVGMTKEDALAEVKRMSGIYFDPVMAGVFIEINRSPSPGTG